MLVLFWMSGADSKAGILPLRHGACARTGDRRSAPERTNGSAGTGGKRKGAGVAATIPAVTICATTLATAIAPITAIRAAFRNILFPSKANCAVATIAGFNTNFSFINKFHL